MIGSTISMRISLKARRYINVILSGTLPFICAAIFTIPNLFMGGHWGQLNWLMQPLATLSIVLSPISWVVFMALGISWAHGKKLHKSIPIIGLVIGPISVVPWVTFLLPVIFLLPSIILSFRLVYFHLGSSSCSQIG